jgi:hypothetical protein
VDAQTRAWFKSLTNIKGEVCCDVADGHRIEDPDWKVESAGYAVRVSRTWSPVDPAQVVKGTNRLGYAIVWLWPVGSSKIRCFMPGTTG